MYNIDSLSVAIFAFVMLSILFLSSLVLPLPRWFQISLLFLSATLARSPQPDGSELTPAKTLVSPLREMIDYGRVITITILSMCALASLVVGRKAHYRVPSSFLFFVIIHLVLVIKMLSSGMIEYAGVAIVTHVLYVFVFGYGVSKWIQSKSDLIWCVRAVAMSTALFCLFNLYQLMINRDALYIGVRFTGTTANPQFAAVLLSLGLPFVAYLVSSNALSLLERCVWGVLACCQAYLLIATGSRAGGSMAIIAVCLAFRRKLGRLVLLVPVVGFGLFQVAEWIGTEADVEYLLRTEDTRSHMWAGLIWNFENYPLFGAPQLSSRLGFAENSWLAMASVCGISGLIPMLVFGVLILFEAGVLSRICARDYSLQLIGDLLLAVVVSLMLGSIFEAYLLGIFNFAVPLLYMCSIMMASVHKLAAQQSAT